MHVYFGTFTRTTSKGIYQFAFDAETGKLEPRSVTEQKGPNFLALHPTGRSLYAVIEVEHAGVKTAAATAYAVDAQTGELAHLNTQPAPGAAGPCHVALDPAGSTLLLACYGSGHVVSYPVQADGSLGPVASIHQHVGSSVNKQRQTSAHTHSAFADATGSFVVVPDLGVDKLMLYRLDAKTSKLTPNDPPSFDVKPGVGPRHFAFHPNGKLGYLISELDSTVTALSVDAARGTLTPIHTVSTLPDGYAGESTTAEIVVHPTGRFLYGSNRGHDSIAVFAVDQTTGRLTPVDIEATRGREPRHFGVDPTGRWLIACNQNSDNVQVFRIDEGTGRLTAVGVSVPVPTPVCVKFLPRT